MKRFLIYVTVLVGLLFVGLTTYYFLRSDEYIGYVNAAENYQTYYMNKGDEMALPLVHTKPDPDTKITILSQNVAVAAYDETKEKIVAVGGGNCTITITTTNSKYSNFIFSIQVGDGTKSNPWLIDSSDDLRKVGVGGFGLSDSYRVVSNITLTEAFTPIGMAVEDGEFSGTFDGGFKTINGLTVTSEATKAGLFSVIAESGVVKNLKLDNVHVNGAYAFAGAIAGENRGDIFKCSVTGGSVKSSATDAVVGGLVGILQYSSAIDTMKVAQVTMCSYNGVVGQEETDENGFATMGGLVGKALGGVITNSFTIVSFNILKDTSYAGAMVGTFDTILVSDTVNGVAKVSNEYLVLRNNYSILNGVLGIGNKGFVGYVPDTAFGTNEIETRRVAGNVYFAEEIGEYNTVSGVRKIATKEEMQGAENITLYTSETGDAWNISTTRGNSIWYIETVYPELNLDAVVESFDIVIKNYNDISTTQKLLDINETMTTNDPSLLVKKLIALGSSYQITKDGENPRVIDLNGAVWTPMGTEKLPFAGSFNGNGCTIKNFVINTLTDGTDALGFFGVVGGTKTIIENINFENVTINADSNDFAGIVAGMLFDSTIKNCTVKNVIIKNANTAGFIVGYNNGVITTTKLSEEGTYNYSVFAFSEGDRYNKIYSDKDTSYIYGGIAGMNYGQIINQRIEGYFEITGKTTANVEVTKVIGGIAGLNAEGKITGSCIESAKLFDLSANVMIGGITAINGTSDKMGGLVGKVECCHVGSENLSTTMEAISSGEIKTYVGGLVAINFADSSVIKSFAKVKVDNGYFVAGLVVANKGKVDQTYSKGSAKGEYVGGFAVANIADITNSYTFLALEGISKDSKIAGGVVFLATPGLVEKCFISASYGGVGQTDIETFANIQGTMINAFISLFNKNYKLGNIQHTLVNTTAAAKAYSDATSFGKQLIGSVTYKTEEECKSGLQAIINALGLDGAWRATEGEFLELSSLNLDNIPQNSVPAVEDPGVGSDPETPEGEEPAVDPDESEQI